MSQFNVFDFEAFSSGKVFSVVSIGEYKDFNTKEHLGSKVEVVILEDNTEYDSADTRNNRFEKLVFKSSNDVNLKVDDIVKPVQPIAKCFGEFHNQLSITCKDVVLVKPQSTTKQ